jgi:hypothetical protein
MDLTQEGFIADPGGHSGKDVRGILFITFRRYGKFHIHYPKPAIEFSEDGKTAAVEMSLLIAVEGQAIPDLDLLYQDPAAWLMEVDKSADLYKLTVELGLESGDWLAKRARIISFNRPREPM